MAIHFSNRLKLGKAIATASETLKKGHFGYKTFVTASNITVSTQAADFPGSSLANPLTAERWKPTAVPATVTIDVGEAVDADYIGMASHTFHQNGCVVTAQYSADGATWTDIDQIAPGDGKPIMFIFGTITARYWRLYITGTSVPSLGVLYIGTLLVSQRGIYGGHTPITMGRNTKIIRNKTEGGQFAGISQIREGVSTTIELKHLTARWYRDEFEPFVIAARARPFFFAWRNQEFPQEVGYVWTTGDIVPSNMGIRDLMQVSFTVEGFSDE